MATRRRDEEEAQAALFVWARAWQHAEPRLRWLHASLNGARLGPRAARTAKRTGMTAGVWDVFLPHPSADGLHTGLYIEMKSATGGLTKEQRAFRAELQAGTALRFVVCRTWVQAAEELAAYLANPALRP